LKSIAMIIPTKLLFSEALIGSFGMCENNCRGEVNPLKGQGSEGN